MKPQETRIGKLLKNSHQYIIPRFQRSYVWGTSETEDKNGQVRIFWKDILEIAQSADSNHFTGSIVIMQNEAKTTDVDAYSVIDGQQRLITTSLLICALRKFYSKQGLDSRLKNNDKTVYGKFKIIVADQDKEIYRLIVEQKKIDRKELKSSPVWKAYQYFVKRLQEIEDNPDQFGCTIEDVYNAVADKLQIICITIEEEDPGSIFESLNYKGQDLTRVDLLKNYLLMNYMPQQDNSEGSEDEEDEDEGSEDEEDEDFQFLFIQNYWNPLCNKLNETRVKGKSVEIVNHLEEYVRHYLMMTGKRVPSKSVYSAFKSKLIKQNKQDLDGEGKRCPLTYTIEQTLTEMTNCATYYRYILGLDVFSACDNKKQNDSINMALSTLNEIKSKSNRCYLLNLFKLHEEKELTDLELAQSISLVESYIVRRTMVTSGLNSNVVDVLFLSLCENKIFKPEDLLEKLESQTRTAVWPSDLDVKNFFKNSNIYVTWNYTNLLLSRIDWYHNVKEPVSGNSTIEHIMPETRSEWWMKNTDETYATKLHTLGNLSLTGYNPEISNSEYPIKLQWYKNSNHPITRNIYNKYNKDWSMDIIDDRTEELINDINKIWPRGIIKDF